MNRDDSVIYRIRRNLQRILFKLTNATVVSRLHYFFTIHGRLHLKNPITFNDKIQWLKLNYYPNNSLAIRCADKYKVRDYITSKGYGYLLNNLIGAWDNVEDIPWEKLPNQFVLKCNHGCAYNLICDNKANFDVEYAKKKLNKWMKENFGEFNGELHYDKIPKRIICEEYLGSKLRDYKFFCFNGKPKFLYVSSDMNEHDKTCATYYWLNGEKAPFQDRYFAQLKSEPDFSHLKEMTKIVSDLSIDFPVARVDLFLTETDKIFFSEITLCPAAGAIEFQPKEYNYGLGKYIDLKNLNGKLV